MSHFHGDKAVFLNALSDQVSSDRIGSLIKLRISEASQVVCDSRLIRIFTHLQKEMVKPGLSRIIGQRLALRKLYHFRLFIPVQMSECMYFSLRLCRDLSHIGFKQSKDPLNLRFPV